VLLIDHKEKKKGTSPEPLEADRFVSLLRLPADGSFALYLLQCRFVQNAKSKELLWEQDTKDTGANVQGTCPIIK